MTQCYDIKFHLIRFDSVLFNNPHLKYSYLFQFSLQMLKIFHLTQYYSTCHHLEASA